MAGSSACAPPMTSARPHDEWSWKRCAWSRASSSCAARRTRSAGGASRSRADGECASVFARATDDPSVFTDPDQFDPDRFLGDPIPRHDYSAFGASTTRTRCLGEGLTLTVGRLFVEQLVCGFDWSVVHRGAPEFSGVHWRPSSQVQRRVGGALNVRRSGRPLRERPSSRLRQPSPARP